MATASPRLEVVSVDLFERPVKLRLPFRFGVVTLRETPQAFVRVEIRMADGRTGIGQSAEMLVPKWFDKNPDLTNAQNVEQLRDALRLTREVYIGGGAATAFGHYAAHQAEVYAAAAARGYPSLVASYGLSLVDRAVIDALARLERRSAADLVRANHLGITTALTPDLNGFDLDAFLATLVPAPTIRARHTVGLIDPLATADIPAGERLDDGLPQSLEECIAAYGLTSFKLKISGDADADIDRLAGIAAILDRTAAPYEATLDGNEQYGSADAIADFWRRLVAEPRLSRLKSSILFVEQPIHRGEALNRPITALAGQIPVEIDESDAGLDSFVTAKALGYTGISSKSCKGFYRSLLNRSRIAHWMAEEPATRWFMSAEDLTTQAGVALQQDLTLASLIGMTHVERNGHHYVDGMAGASPAEQDRFLAAHDDLYARSQGRARLTIRDGSIALGSTQAAHALGTAISPDWDTLTCMTY